MLGRIPSEFLWIAAEAMALFGAMLCNITVAGTDYAVVLRPALGCAVASLLLGVVAFARRGRWRWIGAIVIGASVGYVALDLFRRRVGWL
jgi:hypothetical protein